MVPTTTTMRRLGPAAAIRKPARPRGRRPLPPHLKRERIGPRSGRRRKTLRRVQPGSAPHRRRIKRALRIHPGSGAGDRGCLQEVRLRVHGEDGDEAAAADRKEHSGRVFIGAGDRQQNSRSCARAPAGEDFRRFGVEIWPTRPCAAGCGSRRICSILCMRG